MADDLAAEMREAENKLKRDRELAAGLAKDVGASKLKREAISATRDENERIYRGEPKPEETREHFIGVISDAQHKGLWAEAHRTWGDDCSDPLHRLIERYGFKSTKQIKRVALPAIMQAMARIQAEPTKTPEPPPEKPAARLVPRRVRR